MKRQLTSILLFSALLMGGASTFVSCTDHESDAAYEVTGSIADQLNKQAQNLQNEINRIDGILGTNGTGTPDPNSLQGQVNTLKSDLTTKENELKGLIQQAESATGSVKTELDAKIVNVKNDITTLEGRIATTETDIRALEGRVTAAETAINEAKQAAAAAETNAKNYTDQQIATAIANATTSINAALQGLQSQIEACKTECKTYTDTKFNECDAKIDAKYTELKDICDGLDDQMAQYASMFSQLYAMHSEIDAKLNQDSILLAGVQAEQTRLNVAVNELNTKLDAKVDTANFNAVKAQVEANKALSEANKAEIDAIQAKMVDLVSKTELDNKASQLEAAFKAADATLKSEIQAEITKINEQLNKLFDKMMSMLTGIELQATKSPITGYENFSFLGAEAHILGTYYGSTAAAVKLGGVEIADANNVLIDETSGENAGVVHATLNPSNVDFTGCTLKVVDSQGNEAPFTATVVKSNCVLKYGFVRAGNSNLYDIKINLNKENLEAAKTWTSSDAAALKDVAKNVLDKLRQPSTTRLNIGDAATTIAKTFNNRLTAYALQAEQKYTDANGEEKTRTITSKMSLAATAIKPISYNFLKDNATLKNLDLPSFPTLQSKINFDSYKFNWTPVEHMGSITTSVTLENVPQDVKYTINGVPTPTAEILGRDDVTIKTREDGTQYADLSKLDVKIGDIDFGNAVSIEVVKGELTRNVTIEMDKFNEVIDNINNQVGNMVGNVNNIVDQIKGYADIFDGQYIAGINKFIQKFENLLRKSNSLLQPAMFYVASNGNWNQLAREGVGASYLKLQGGKASTVFVASSYTGEILAPAYKKYVHVTNAPTGAKVSGANLNKVIDGNLHKIGFEADKEGTYEITYEAVDYSGVKVAKKFYVKVVK